MVAATVASLVASVLLALGGLSAGGVAAGGVTAGGLSAGGAAEVAALAAGRFVTGVGVALAMAVGSTWVTELSVLAGRDRATGTRRGALWLTVGFGLGAGVAGVLAQWAPWPAVLPYLVHVLLAAAVLGPLLRLPETRGMPVPRAGGQFAGVRHPRFRRVVLPMAPWIFGSAGVAYAIMPQLVGERVGSWGLVYATAVTVCTLGAGVLVQPLAKRLDRTTSARGVLVGMVVMSGGLAVSAAAAVVRSPVLALVAAVVLGGAYGIAVVSGLLELTRLARPADLAALTGVYYALAYVGFLLPSLLALLSPVASYPVMLGALVLVALAGTVLIARHSRHHLPTPL
jgi:hypothetical protein